MGPVLLRFLLFLGRALFLALALGRVALGFRRFLRGVTGVLRILLARFLFLAFHVVAFLACDGVVRIGLSRRHVVAILRRVLVLGRELRLGDFLLAFGFGHADVLGIALHIL